MGRIRLSLMLAVSGLAAVLPVPAVAGDKPGPAAPKDPEAEPPLEGEAKKQYDADFAAYLKQIKGEGNRELVRTHMQQIATKGRAGRDALIEFARTTSNQAYIEYAFESLAKIRGRAVREHLTGKYGLRSDDSYVQIVAAKALGEAKDLKAIPALLEVVDAKSTKIEVQGACLIALGKLGKADTGATEALLRYAETKMDTVRANALEGLGYLATDYAIKTLKDHLTADKNTRCRGAAALGLGHTLRKDVVPALEAALAKDESMTVKDCISRALKELGAAK